MVKFIRNKVLFLLMLVAVFGITFRVSAQASSVALDSWYSNGNDVGYWSISPKVYFTNLSNSMNISQYVSSAVDKWEAKGIDSSITTTPFNSNINFYAGTMAELNAVGFAYTTGINGLTQFDSKTYMTLANSYYKIYKVEGVSSSTAREAGSEYYENVTLHEYGHSMGWMGHSDNSGSVMYSISMENNVNLQDDDVKQLLQVYNAMR